MKSKPYFFRTQFSTCTCQVTWSVISVIIVLSWYIVLRFIGSKRINVQKFQLEKLNHYSNIFFFISSYHFKLSRLHIHWSQNFYFLKHSRKDYVAYIYWSRFKECMHMYQRLTYVCIIPWPTLMLEISNGIRLKNQL